jgi:hypothetical protein
MIIPDFCICTRKNGWYQSVWLFLISAYGQGRMAEPKHMWLSLISTYVQGRMAHVWCKPFFLVHMQKSGIIIRVWAQSFFHVHMQKSGIIICVWAQAFFLVHRLKSPNMYDYPWFLHMYKKEWLIQIRLIIPDFCICTRKNGWYQSIWLSLIYNHTDWYQPFFLVHM